MKWKEKEFALDKATEYLHREPFSFDPETDPGFRQYRDQYMKLGQQVAADTASMVNQYAGGYDNTYARTAGQQAYQRYVSQLHNAVPTYQQSAYNRYNTQGDALLKQLELIRGMTEPQTGVGYDQSDDRYTPAPLSNEDILGPYVGLLDLGMLSPDQWRSSTDWDDKHTENGDEFKSYDEYAADFMQRMVMANTWKPEAGLLIKPGLMKEYIKLTQDSRKNYGMTK